MTIYLDGVPVDDGWGSSWSVGPPAPPPPPPPPCDHSFSVDIAHTSDILGLLTCSTSLPHERGLIDLTITPSTPRPSRLTSRRGRPIYGCPSIGAPYWTHRAGDALERRRVRSRVAAYGRRRRPVELRGVRIEEVPAEREAIAMFRVVHGGAS